MYNGRWKVSKCRSSRWISVTWATTLVLVDVAAQNPMSVTIPTKSDENAYLSALCTAFAKRMAYANAVLRVDPEPALKTPADRIALLRASADGIQLKVETAPRFSQSIGAVGRAQDAVEGQTRCLRLELEARLSREVTPAMDIQFGTQDGCSRGTK